MIGVALSTPANAQPPRAVVVGREVPEPARTLPAARVEAGSGPATESGFALRGAVVAPLNDGISIGGAISHLRFAGTPELRPLTTLTVPFEVHSGFASDVSFRFGLKVGVATSDAACAGDGVALGLSAGCRVRTAGRFGLSLKLSAFAKRDCGDQYPDPGSGTATTWGQAILEFTYDLGGTR